MKIKINEVLKKINDKSLETWCEDLLKTTYNEKSQKWENKIVGLIEDNSELLSSIVLKYSIVHSSENAINYIRTFLSNEILRKKSYSYEIAEQAINKIVDIELIYYHSSNSYYWIKSDIIKSKNDEVISLLLRRLLYHKEYFHIESMLDRNEITLRNKVYGKNLINSLVLWGKYKVNKIKIKCKKFLDRIQETSPEYWTSADITTLILSKRIELSQDLIERLNADDAYAILLSNTYIKVAYELPLIEKVIKSYESISMMANLIKHRDWCYHKDILSLWLKYHKNTLEVYNE